MGHLGSLIESFNKKDVYSNVKDFVLIFFFFLDGINTLSEVNKLGASAEVEVTCVET